MERAILLKLVQRLEARSYFLLRTVQQENTQEKKEILQKEITQIHMDSCQLLSHLETNTNEVRGDVEGGNDLHS